MIPSEFVYQGRKQNLEPSICDLRILLERIWCEEFCVGRSKARKKMNDEEIEKLNENKLMKKQEATGYDYV